MGLFLIELLLGRCVKIDVLYWKYIVFCVIEKVFIVLRKLEFGLLFILLFNKYFLGGGIEGIVCYFWF